MAQQVNCPCGKTIRGESDDEIVANVEEHIRTGHPEQVGQRTREEILAMAEPA